MQGGCPVGPPPPPPPPLPPALKKKNKKQKKNALHMTHDTSWGMNILSKVQLYSSETFPIVYMTMSFLILAMIVTVSMVEFKPVVWTAIPPLAVVGKDGTERGAGGRGGVFYQLYMTDFDF